MSDQDQDKANEADNNAAEQQRIDSEQEDFAKKLSEINQTINKSSSQITKFETQVDLLYGRSVTEEEVLVLDNKTVMHGRRELESEDARSIGVRFGHLAPEWKRVLAASATSP